ncbi:MAG: transposase [Candidatus Sulfotelmatobacter sp.]
MFERWAPQTLTARGCPPLCAFCGFDSLTVATVASADLATARRRDLFGQILEEVRQRHGSVVVRYVAMPDHVHLLITEPERVLHPTH